jgi:hypothetical protein
LLSANFTFIIGLKILVKIFDFSTPLLDFGSF